MKHINKVFSIILIIAIMISVVSPSVVSIDDVTLNVGDVIEFGTYPKNEVDSSYVGKTVSYNDKTYSIEPVKWRVLKVENGKALLLSSEIIDGKRFNSTSATVNGYKANNYFHSEIREWLVNDFYNTAFSNYDKEAIVSTQLESTIDNVFLLSKTEADSYAKKYFSTTATDYAYGNGFVPQTSTELCNQWWTRTAANNSYSVYYVQIRWGNWTTYYNWYDDTIPYAKGVRPAIYIDVEKYNNGNINVNSGNGSGSNYNPNSNFSLYIYGAGNTTLGNESLKQKVLDSGLSGVKATISGSSEEYISNKDGAFSSGIIEIEHSKVTGDITLSKSGYRNFVIPKAVYDSLDKTWKTSMSITMNEDNGKNLFVSSVYARESGSSNSYENIFSDSLTINQDKSYEFYITTNVPSGGKLYLQQEGTTITSAPAKIEVKNGYNTVSGSAFKSFRKDMTTNLVCIDGSDSAVQSLKLNIQDASDSNWFVKEVKEGNLNIGGKNGLSITLPEDWLLVGGSTIDLATFKFPVGLDIQGNDIKISVGFDLWKKETTEKTSKNMTDLQTGEKYNKSTKIETKTSGVITDGVWETVKQGLKGEKSAWENAKTDYEKKQIQQRLCDKYGISPSQLGSNNVKKMGFTAGALGYVEGKIINGQFVITELMISVSGEFTISYTAQLQAGYLGVEGGAKGVIKITRSRELADPELKFGTDLSFTITPEITLRGGVGWDGVAAVGAYGKAEAPTWLSFEFSQSKKLGIQFKGEIGYEAQVLIWKTGKKPLISGETEKFEKVWSWDGSSRSKIKKVVSSNTTVLSDNELETTVIERPDTESNWLGSSNAKLPKKIKGNSVASAVTVRNLQTDIYEKTGAKVITAGDITVATWLTEDKNRDDYNWQKLMYSVYDKSEKTWSEPQSVCDDGYIDSSPYLATDGNNIYLVWQKFVKNFTEENSNTASKILQAGEIYLAKFNKSASSFVNATRLTNDNVYDYNPTVSVIDGVPYIHYSTNANNELLSANGNSISRYVNGTTTVFKADLPSVNSMASAVVDNKVQLTYSVDTDGDISTTNDISLFSGVDTFEKIEKADDNEASVLNFTYADIDGKSTLVWSDGMNICYEKDGETVSALVNGATISSQLNSVTDSTGTYLFWTTADGEKAQINYCIYKDGKWTEAFALTSRSSKFADIGLTSVNNKLLGIASETMLSYDEASDTYTQGNTNLVTFGINDYCDVTVTDVEVDDTLLDVGDEVSVSVIVENNGNTTIDDLIVNLTDTNGTSKSFEVEADLLPGCSDLYYLPYEIGENYAGSTVTVEVEAEGDVDTSDNTATYTADKAKVVIVEDSIEEHEEGYVVNAIVVNENLIEAENIVVNSSFSDEDDAGINGTVSVGNLTSDGKSFVQFIFEKDEIEYNDDGTANVYLTVNADNAESHTVSLLLKDDDLTCGHPVTEDIAEVPATCTEKGASAATFCTACESYVTGGEEIPALGHSFTNYVSNNDATCTQDGTKTAKCDRCDEVNTVTDEGSTKGHTPSSWIIDRDSDCVNGGTKHQACVVCGETIKTEEIPATGHQYADTVIAPTCTAEGYTTHTCSVCGDTYTDSTVSALGHSFTNYVSNNDATCTQDGTKTAECDRCDLTDTVTDEGSAKGHTLSAWITDKDSDCISGGTKHQICSACGETIKTEEIPAKGHDYVDTVTAPSCTAEGYTTHTCTVCGDAYTDSVVNAIGHSPAQAVKENIKAASCTAIGSYDSVVYCSVCKAEISRSQKTVAKIAHKYIATVIKPTCTANGYTTHKCSVCGNTYTDTVVKANGHKNKTTTTPATTSADGKIMTTCTVCKKTLKTTLIYKASSIKLSGTSYVYNGKVQKPTVTVKNSKGIALENGTDYTVSYSSGCKNTGKYAVKITFKGNYSGSKTLYFNILPSKTTSLTAAQSTTAIKATWKAVAGASGYYVTLYNAKNKALKTVDTTKTTYTFSKLTAGTVYKIRVTAYKTIDGKKVLSSVYMILTTATKPGTPTLKVTAGFKKATLSWNKQTGATGYVVYMATSKNGKYTKIATLKGNTKVSYTKTGLTKGKTYYFKVAAYETIGGKNIYGSFSSVKYAKIK